MEEGAPQNRQIEGARTVMDLLLQAPWLGKTVSIKNQK